MSVHSGYNIHIIVYYKLHKVKVHFTSICINCHCSKNTLIPLKEKKDLVKAVSNSLRRSWDHRVPQAGQRQLKV